MSNRKARKPINGIFRGTSIGVTEYPELPGLGLYELHLGSCDTTIPPGEARGEFSRLVSMIHRHQEDANRQWLEDKVAHLCFPLERTRRAEKLKGVKWHLEQIAAKTKPDSYDVTISKLFETAATHLAKPTSKLSADQIGIRLRQIYGPRFSRRFPQYKIRRAFTDIQKGTDFLIARESRRLRKSTPQSAQL